MPPTRLTKLKTYTVTDGANRGPLTMAQVRFHPTERVLLAACGDRRVALWNLDAAETTVRNVTAVPGVLVCPHEAGWVRCLDVAPDGRALVTGGSDRRLKRWAWADGQPGAATHDVEAHAGWVEAVAFSPDGRRLVTGGADRAVKVWDATTLAPVRTLTGHTGFVRDVAWLPDGSAIVSGGEDGKLLVWDAATFALRRTIDFGGANEQFGQNPALSGVHRLHVSRDGKWLAAAGGRDAATLFELATGSPVAADRLETQVCFSPTDDVLAAGSNSVKVTAYDAARLRPVAPDRNGRLPTPPALPGRELAQVRLGDFSLGLRFSADGKRLALGRADGKVEVWEVA